MSEFYIRRDDPGEKVKIESQERCPNGRIFFVFILPEHHQGKKGEMNANTFHAAYKPEHEDPPKPPAKPLSSGSRDEWRAWALKLEVDYANMKRSYERVCDATGQW